MASAPEASDRSGEPIRPALERVSTELGRELGVTTGSMTAVLDRLGYEPVDDEAGGVLLSNCPFHRVARHHTETICGANAALLQGVAEGAGEHERRVVFEPRDGYCCVRLVAAGSAQHEARS